MGPIFAEAARRAKPGWLAPGPPGPDTLPVSQDPNSLALAGCALVLLVAVFGGGFFLGWFVRGLHGGDGGLEVSRP
jgi:hypothetical protein